MKLITISPPSNIINNNLKIDPLNRIHVFMQFFIHRDPVRNREIQFCLKQNLENPLIYKIHLLNERIYSNAELGLRSENRSYNNKIVQTVVGHRLRFQDVFSYIRTNNILGFHILVNSDICFATNALTNLQKTDIHLSKKMYALLRFEYNSTNPSKSPIFGPRFDSQDTWIFHSNFPIDPKFEKAFGFEFGKPGCDNKIVYLANILGYEVINDPLFIQTYHVHSSRDRDYSAKDAVPPPWGLVVPAGLEPTLMPQSLGINMRQISIDTQNFQDMQFDDNRKIYDYISLKIQSGTPFILPRIIGIEHNLAVFSRMIRDKSWPNVSISDELMQYINRTMPEIHRNEGMKMSSIKSAIKYSDAYLEAFDHCDLYTGWNIYDAQYNILAQSQDYIKQNYASKKMIWSLAFDIFHYIHSTPWTTAMRSKRILIISLPSITELINKQLANRNKLYGVELFPECEITTLSFINDNTRDFDIILEQFAKQLQSVQDTFDIALISCGSYSNLMCARIFKMGKSAIYVGNVIQMYFGILGHYWLKDRSDIVRLYLNEHWTRSV